MDIQEVAALLDGSSYPLRMPKELEEKLKEAGLVVVVGGSDDLMCLYGAIRDEFGCYNGGEALVDKRGILDRDQCETDDELRDYFAREQTARKINAIWCPEPVGWSEEYAWTYRTEIPHSGFDVMDDGEKWCRAIVFSVADL